MPQKVRELRRLIYGQYDSEADMAKAIGWPRQRLNKITNGSKEPNVSELGVIAEALGAGVEEVAQIFLRYKSPNEQLNVKSEKGGA